MSTSLVVNGVSYLYPDTGDQSWGTVASAWAAAVTSGTLQKAGGAFTLTADANFGANFGILSKYFTSQTASAAASGVVRLASTEAIAWRNNAGGGDILLAKNSSDQLTYAGVVIASSAGVTPVAAGGTGLTSGTAGGILGFTGTGVIASSALLTANQLIVGGGAAATPLTLAAGSQYQVLLMGATTPGYGAVNLAQSAAVTGILPNANTTAASANTASAIVTRDGSGNFIAGTITAALTGAASGNTSYTANQYGVVLSGSGNTMSILAPDASTSKVLQSGGASANPTWLAFASAATASVLVQRDANANILCNNILENYRTTATGAATTTLVIGDAYLQYFTGSTTQTIVLPDATTLQLGHSYFIVNLSSGVVTVNKNGGSLVQSMAANSFMTITVTNIGTAAGSWNPSYSVNNAGGGTVTSVTYTGDGVLHSSTPSSAVTTTGTLTASLKTQTKNTILSGPTTGSNATPTFRAMVAADITPALIAPTVTTYTSTPGGNYTTPAGVLYLKIKMVGGGGGGGGSGTAAGGNGGSGTASTFGSSLLSAGGGAGGAFAGNGGGGGTNSFGTATVLVNLQGGSGSGPAGNTTGSYPPGGTGAASPFGGAGGGGINSAGATAIANSGSGGGGGGGLTTAVDYGGGGGGAGGYLEVIVYPTAAQVFTTIAVGGGGTAGSNGTNGGGAGGVGGTGYIVIEEHYQ